MTSKQIDAEHNGRAPHPLREAIESLGRPLSRWTVMSPRVDPCRLDTPANNAKAAWLAEAIERGIPLPVHARGIHYVISTDWHPYPKPSIEGSGFEDGSTYLNDLQHSMWMEDVVGVARWLNYIDFDAIKDKHSDEPVERFWTPPQPAAWVQTAEDFELEVPGVDDLRPRVQVADFVGTQPYHLVIFGEKTILFDALSPIADRYEADLFLATGDATNSMVYRMAKHAAEDGRPLIVLYFSDCDPGGYNMAIVLARKLSAFQLTHFPDLDAQIWRAGLTPQQVASISPKLPESPLKPGEKRAARWKKKFGVEQTELDSLVLRPELLRQMAEDAIAPFYDATLHPLRVARARRAWEANAQRRLEEHVEPEVFERCERVADRVAEMRDEMERLVSSVQVDADGFDLPGIVVPEARLAPPAAGEPLWSSSWSFREQTERLRAAKRYET